MTYLIYNQKDQSLQKIEAGAVPPCGEHEVVLPLWVAQQSLTKARKVYHGRSRSQGIRAMCIECSGTAQEARKCVAYNCPLWTFRPGSRKGDLPPNIPPVEVFDRILSEEQEIMQGNPREKTREHTQPPGGSASPDTQKQPVPKKKIKRAAL